MFKIGSPFTLKWLKDFFEEDPLDLKFFDIFRCFVILFASVKATFSAFRVGRVSVRSFRWISEFFILLMKISRIHMFSPAVILHFFAISARAPRNFSND